MPKLPIVEIQSPTAGGIAPTTTTFPQKAIQDFAKTAAVIATEIQNVQDNHAVNQGKLALNKRLGEVALQIEQMNDPDQVLPAFDSLYRYRDELIEGMNRNQAIVFKADSDELLMKGRFNAAGKSIQIRQEQTLAGLQRRQQEVMDLVANTRDPSMVSALLDDFASDVERTVAVRAMTPSAGIRAIAEADNAATSLLAENIINDDPMQALMMFANGSFDRLSPSQRISLGRRAIGFAQTRVATSLLDRINRAEATGDVGLLVDAEGVPLDQVAVGLYDQNMLTPSQYLSITSQMYKIEAKMRKEELEWAAINDRLEKGFTLNPQQAAKLWDNYIAQLEAGNQSMPPQMWGTLIQQTGIAIPQAIELMASQVRSIRSPEELFKWVEQADWILDNQENAHITKQLVSTPEWRILSEVAEFIVSNGNTDINQEVAFNLFRERMQQADEFQTLDEAKRNAIRESKRADLGDTAAINARFVRLLEANEEFDAWRKEVSQGLLPWQERISGIQRPFNEIIGPAMDGPLGVELRASLEGRLQAFPLGGLDAMTKEAIRDVTANWSVTRIGTPRLARKPPDSEKTGFPKVYGGHDWVEQDLQREILDALSGDPRLRARFLENPDFIEGLRLFLADTGRDATTWLMALRTGQLSPEQWADMREFVGILTGEDDDRTAQGQRLPKILVEANEHVRNVKNSLPTYQVYLVGRNGPQPFVFPQTGTNHWQPDAERYDPNRIKVEADKAQADLARRQKQATALKLQRAGILGRPGEPGIIRRGLAGMADRITGIFDPTQGESSSSINLRVVTDEGTVVAEVGDPDASQTVTVNELGQFVAPGFLGRWLGGTVNPRAASGWLRESFPIVDQLSPRDEADFEDLIRRNEADFDAEAARKKSIGIN